MHESRTDALEDSGTPQKLLSLLRLAAWACWAGEDRPPGRLVPLSLLRLAAGRLGRPRQTTWPPGAAQLAQAGRWPPGQAGLARQAAWCRSACSGWPLAAWAG